MPVIQNWTEMFTLLLIIASLSGRNCLLLDTVPCPASSPCTCPSANIIECGSTHLYNAPNFINNNIPHAHLEVHLNDNMIGRIVDKAFTDLWSPQHKPTDISINLSNNRLAQIADRAFFNIEDLLIYLNMEFNRLPYLPKALTYLTKLQTLLMADNPLITIQADVLQPLHQTLTSFSFGTAGSIWPTNVTVLDHLHELKVDGTDISDIPHNGFGNLRNTLQTLILNNTKMEVIPNEVCFLYKLESLSFNTGSVIDENEMVPRCRLYNVHYLELSGTGLYRFPNEIFNMFQNIGELRLRDLPHLNGIENAQFPPNNHIHTLALHNMAIPSISTTISNLPLRTLDLTGSDVTCGCLMQWLTSYERTYDITVLGNCSNYQQSVQDFIRHYLYKFC